MGGFLIPDALRALCRLVVRVFFRELEIVGRHNVPDAGPVVLVINHPNGLLDPVVVLGASLRHVSFLAKEPLFRMFFVGFFVRALRCLPVYRQVDGADPAKNRLVVARAIELLSAGNAIALFPEGTSHSEPDLKPLRSGAARIALSAASGLANVGAKGVQIVPVGLNYFAKARFRSKALVLFGPALAVPVVPTDASLNPEAGAVETLMVSIREALASVILTASSAEALRLVERAERQVSAAIADEAVLKAPQASPALTPLADRTVMRRRLLAGYEKLEREEPGVLGDTLARLDAFEERMAAAGLRPGQRLVFSSRTLWIRGSLTLLTLGLLSPLAALGLLTNYPAYLLIQWLAPRVAKGEEDILATIKVLAGLLAFPLSWGLAALALLATSGGQAALGLALLSPLGAYAGLLAVERGRGLLGPSYAAALALVRPEAVRALVAERRTLRARLAELAERMGV